MAARFMGLERALLGLFVVSGFAALIYQSIWSHYLGLTLGHAAYAQTLVLSIFMGGMALGAWLVSRFGAGWRRLVLAYAWVEIVIGLAALAFHPLFLGYREFSQEAVYPALTAAAAVRAWQWGSAALLIAPQCVLLGMTFPLMSGGYLRVAPRADGEILGGLYFTNSLGAAIGALAATFLLLPVVGMPGSMAFAGVISLGVGLVAFRIARHVDLVAPSTAVPATGPASSPAPRGGRAGFYRLMLAAAVITGASSFVYEIGWVRLLNQSLGTTVHSFELMLAAFVLGLAFGGWWIRKRSHRIDDVVGYAGHAQIFMGMAALVSVPVFAQSFRWVGAMVDGLPKTPVGYQMFSLGSGVIALMVMFPAAFFAGMTLPLFTMALLRRGHGEGSIGRIYAANTLGAILGVVAAVHVLIPLLGLRLAVSVAALADILLGLVLLKRAGPVAGRTAITVGVACVAVVAGSLFFGRLDPLALASGVFRHGQTRLDAETRVHYLRDGKTATVALFTQGSVGTISTNGKPDASLQLDPSLGPPQDEVTMLMAAALPLAIHPAPREIAVIGWGSGLTTHTLLGSQVPTLVDSIEIERAMYDGARLFGSRVERAYADPRSRLHVDDARTYFSTGQKKYDVIISEPSNPWVSGVSALFTHQFYAFLGQHLAEGGIVVQWLQVYELDDSLLATMMAALASEFPHIDVYLTNTGDLLFVSSRRPLPALDVSRIADPVLAAELARVGLAGEGDFRVRRLGSEKLVDTLVEQSGAIPHSDFHPVVALQAPASRFMGRSASRPIDLAYLGMPVLEFTDGARPIPASVPITYTSTSVGSETHTLSRLMRQALLGSAPGSLFAAISPDVASVPARLKRLEAGVEPDEDWYEALSIAAEFTVAQLPPADLQGVWIEPVWIEGTLAPESAAVLAAFEAAALRDAPRMRILGLAALDTIGEAAPVLLRQQLLMIALLGASREGGDVAVRAVEASHGRTVPAQGHYGLARSYLLAHGGLMGER